MCRKTNCLGEFRQLVYINLITFYYMNILLNILTKFAIIFVISYFLGCVMKRPYIVLPDKSVPAEYKYPGIPIFIKSSSLAFQGYEALRHWHTGVEFFYIYSGSMNMFINGDIVRINQGEGIFINSRRLHYSFSETKEDCFYLIVSLDFLSFQPPDTIISNYLERKFGLNTVDYLLLSPDIPWEEQLIKTIRVLYKAIDEDEINPLRLLALGYDICDTICEHIDNSEEDKISYQERMTFLNMTSFIGLHYQERITLEDIAAAGAVCRSKCCQIFQQQIRQSPNSYLIQYRIAKSCELLRNADTSIGDIAHLCGFQSSSYFTNVFQKHTGCSPREYRLRNK